MVVAAEPTVQEWILELIDAEIEGGATPNAAAQKALDRVICEGRSEEVLREIGRRFILDLWEYKNRQARAAAAREPGERRHDPAGLRTPKSLLECLYEVGDEWVRLGNMDTAKCRRAYARFRAQGEGNLREAHMFQRIMDSLGPRQIVRNRFTDEQLRGFLREFRLE